jgi:hypothetical protein
MEYAILDNNDVCINRVLWDGESSWDIPEGCTAVADPDNLHPIYQEPQSDPVGDPLASLTGEQKAALLTLLQQS